MVRVPARNKADIYVEHSNAFCLQKTRRYYAFPTHGSGIGTGVMEILAAMQLARKKWGPNADVRPIGNSLYMVRFEEGQT